MWLITTGMAKYCTTAFESLQDLSQAIATTLHEIDAREFPTPGSSGRLYQHRPAADDGTQVAPVQE